MPSVRQRGFTYLGVMFIVSVLAMTATLGAVVWSTAHQRDSERELVFIGQQFQAAIDRYRQHSTNPASPYPQRLEALVHDDRGVAVRRHLRRIYVDPMTGDARWGLIRLPDGGIVGVHSLSERKPYPRKYVVSGFVVPVGDSYRDWRFIAPSATDLAITAIGPAVAPPASASAGPVDTPRVAEVDTSPVAEQNPPPIEPDAAPSGSLARPAPEDYRSRTPEACARITAYEEQVCLDLATRSGDDAGRACQDSALARSVACSLGQAGALPVLVRRAR